MWGLPGGVRDSELRAALAALPPHAALADANPTGEVLPDATQGGAALREAHCLDDEGAGAGAGCLDALFAACCCCGRDAPPWWQRLPQVAEGKRAA